MSDFLIIIDPGHGGINPSTGEYVTPGKRSPAWTDMPQIFEGVQNRDIARRFAALLKKKRIDFRFTVHPDDWRDVPLAERVQIANDLHKVYPDAIYVSIHANAFSNPDANGLEVYANIGATDASVLPGEIYRSLKAKLPELYARGIKEEAFYVLRNTTMSAALCEIGFMTNHEDAAKMNTAAFRQRAAQGLLEAILPYAPGAKTGKPAIIPLILLALGILGIGAIITFT